MGVGMGGRGEGWGQTTVLRFSIVIVNLCVFESLRYP